MDISESISLAFKTLWANRLRSLLTVLGIIIGNASLVAMVSVGQGAQRYTSDLLQSLGTNLLFVFSNTGDARRGTQQANTLMLSDAVAIAAQIPLVKEVAPQINFQTLVSYSSRAIRTNAIGTTPSFESVRSSPVAQGRFLTALDQEYHGEVAVLGPQLARELFGALPPLGERVRLNNVSFRVVGVMTEKGASSGSNQDEAVFIPITTMANLIAGRTSPAGTSVNYIAIAVVDNASLDIAQYQITNLLRLRHNISGADDFTVRNQKDIVNAANNVTSGLALMLVVVAGICLVVGGFGIMNTMLASVTQRTYEIGLRKAIGASQTDILQQFLTEAIILALAGGLSGTGLGAVATLLIAMYTPFQAGVSIGAVILAISVSSGIGLIFGVMPAQRAARLDPIMALRNL
jgi:putative ABC transport system permease protein